MKSNSCTLGLSMCSGFRISAIAVVETSLAANHLLVNSAGWNYPG